MDKLKKDKLKAIFDFNILGNVLQPAECIVCRSNKTDASSGGYEKLIMCQTQAGDEFLALFCASTFDDCVKAQLTGLTQEDIIAQEFWYHRSCQSCINHTKREY